MRSRGDTEGEDPAGLGRAPTALAELAGRPAPERGLARAVGLNAVLAAAVGAPRSPPRLGRYLLERKVGAGGMGVVFRARPEDGGPLVAVKVLTNATSDQRSRFAREVAVLRTLRHEAIVRYLDDGHADDGAPYLVMEWLEGLDLADRLDAGPLGVDEALRMGMRAARGLGAAHAAGVVHRDVKPANLFLLDGSVDAVRVLDFGIARGDTVAVRLTATGLFVGTPSYMAPEQFRGEHGVSADVWGLGVTLFQSLTGQLPFRGDDPATVLSAVVNQPTPSLVALRPDAPRALDLLLGRMLAKAPKDRPGSMNAVWAELSDLRAELVHFTPPAAGLSMREQTRRAEDGGVHEDTLEANAEGRLVGRSRALGQLRGLLGESLDESVANVVLLTGPEGVGRTAVVRELGAEVHRAWPGARVLEGAGEPGTRQRPFGLLRGLIGPPHSAPEVRALLDKLDEGGEAAAGAALLWSDALRLAWLTQLEAWAGTGPVVVLVDDAHAADLVSMRYLARGAVHLRDHAFFVMLATHAGAREAELHATLTACGVPAIAPVALAPLRRAALSHLAARWAPGAPAAMRSSLLDRADGRPGRLRVLVRALDAGLELRDGTSTSLLGARIEALDPDSRRLLRAASVLEARFSAVHVAAVLGGGAVVDDVEARLAELEAKGFLRRASSADARTRAVWNFNDALTRAAFYGLLTPDDLALGHRAAAEVLAADGSADPARVAAHLQAGGTPERAAPYWLRAARGALAGGDTGAFAEALAQGLEHAEAAPIKTELRLLGAEGAFWSGEVERALSLSAEAVEGAPPGSTAWLRAQSSLLTAAGQLGRNDQVWAVGETLSAYARPEVGEARDAWVMSCGRIATQASALSSDRGDGARQALRAALDAGGLGALARAWAWRGLTDGRAVNYDASIEAFTRAHEAHVEAGDPRGAAQVQLYLGSLFCWTGAWARADTVIDDARRVASLLGADYLEVWAEYTRGKLLAETRSLDEARGVLRRVVERTGESPRMRAGAWLYLALAALRHDAPLEACDAAAHAVEAATAPAIRGPALAVQALAHLALGETEAALAHAAALEAAAQVEVVEQDALVGWATFEVLRVAGRPADAQLALERAAATLRRRAATLESPWRRHECLHGPYAHARLLACGR
jgi:hypothetical protein